MSSRPKQPTNQKKCNEPYCHECGHGPCLWKIFVMCINCDHILCQGGPQVYIKPERPRASQQSLSLKSRKNRTRQAFNSRFHIDLASIRPPAKTTDHKERIDCFGSDLPVLPDLHFTASVFPFPSGEEHAWSRSENMWKCCNCGHSGALIATTPSCLDCGHQKCYYCSIIEP